MSPKKVPPSFFTPDIFFQESQAIRLALFFARWGWGGRGG
jgi:hypothetical protein